MTIEELLGLTNIIVGLFLAIFIVAYVTTKDVNILLRTRVYMGVVLTAVVFGMLFGGFHILGGALTEIESNPIGLLAAVVVVTASKVIAVAGSIIGTTHIIIDRQKRLEREDNEQSYSNSKED